jgi:hypothetical protein
MTMRKNCTKYQRSIDIMADKSKLKGLSDKYKKVLGSFPTTTVNKNSPLKGMSDKDSFMARKMKLTGSALTAGIVKPSTVGKVASNIFKKSPVGRVIDAGTKIGLGAAAGYEYAKSKFKDKEEKVDKKATGGMAEYIKDLL